MNTDFSGITLSALAAEATSRLEAIYPPDEARWLVRVIFEELKGYSRVDMLMRADDEMSTYISGKVRVIVDRLLTYEPIQYIFGHARFYGLKINVTPDTLIPRPETEELVDLVVNWADGRSDLRVLDACTGSGCIAVALARTLLFPRIEAFDLSPKALEVAQGNAGQLRVKVDFFEADALHLPKPEADSLDVVVSNPPYITESEREAMNPNVLDYEPHMALFAPQGHPLAFYHAIADYAMKAMVGGGALFFEINPLYADTLSAQLKQAGWQSVDVLPDMQRRLRFIRAIAPAK